MKPQPKPKPMKPPAEVVFLSPELRPPIHGTADQVIAVLAAMVAHASIGVTTEPKDNQ